MLPDQHATLNLLAPVIGAFWEERSFVQIDETEWVRRWGWKSDRIRLIPGAAGAFINLDVLIPPDRSLNEKFNASFDSECIASTSLGSLVRQRARFVLPLLASRGERVVQDVVRTFPIGLNWLSGYDTRQSCLARLRSPHVNPESEAFKYHERFLVSLPPETDLGACLRESVHWYQNGYSRRIFAGTGTSRTESSIHGSL